MIPLDTVNCIVNQIWLNIWKQSLVDSVELVDTD